MKIIFMGTAGFAVPSLEILFKKGYTIAAVITAPDKPAGRGLQVKESPVKQFAAKHNLKTLQPKNLKDNSFIQELKRLKPDLQVVVAFRMLPAIIWQLPPLGTFNLHASLLPDYRGAAPINWAIINGEKETGVSTFFIKQAIDKGDIIFQETSKIDKNETAGELHDRLMISGAALVLKTAEAIEKNNAPQIKQTEKDNKKQAPKIFKQDCKINWQKDANQLHNFIRGLSPYPAAWTTLKEKQLRIFKSSKDFLLHSEKPGTIVTDNKSYMNIAVPNGFINLLEVQLEGKKRLPITDFLRGVSLQDTVFLK